MKHRAQTLSGEWVTGWYYQAFHPEAIYDKHRMFIGEKGKWVNIRVETLSIETSKLDSAGNMIFGSFELVGTMTKGGDVVQDYGKHGYPVVYSKAHCAFIVLSEGEYWSMLGDYREGALTITGKQSEAQDE